MKLMNGHGAHTYNTDFICLCHILYVGQVLMRESIDCEVRVFVELAIN